jgi:uncharacterized protein YidB (DUF937 family)
MPKYDTKLKLGRKFEDVPADVASDNQVSVLFRHDDAGQDKHVSVTIESDTMSPDDVAALLQLLESRGIFTKVNSKTWVSQPQASEARFGKTMVWHGTDIKELAHRASSMLPPT